MTDLILDDLKLLPGEHSTRKDGVCAMEAVAWLAGEPHSDHPQCTCPVIAQLVRSWNDALPYTDRNRLLKPLLPLLLGTRSTREIEEQRAYIALDWLVREYTAAWLDLANLSADANALRALVPLSDIPAAQAARTLVENAHDHAEAAWAAAGAAARAAAGGAARAAAGAAAWAAAGAAAGEAIQPTVHRLQQSCVKLIRRMCEIK